MDVNVSLDIFQEKISDLMERIEFVHTCFDDLLICNATFEEDLSQLTDHKNLVHESEIKSSQ